MANGYLGKISAVVSANTSDFRSKISAAAKDVQAFARSMQGSLSSAQSQASTSLRGIYTEAQKVERALRAVAGGKLSFSGFNGRDMEQAAGKMRMLVSVTNDITRPLTQGVKGFQRLSESVRGQFMPALISAQKAAEALVSTIDRTGTVSQQRFDAVAAKIARVTAAMKQMEEASAMVARLGTGVGLRFSAPRQFDAFNRASALGQRADSLSADASSRLNLGRTQALILQRSKKIEELNAERLNAVSLGKSTAGVDARIEQETDRLEALLRVYERLIEKAQQYEMVKKGGFVDVKDVKMSPAADEAKRAKAETERLRAAQAQRRAEAASRFLRVDQRESELLTNEGLSTTLANGYSRNREGMLAGRSLGPGLGNSSRQMDVLRTGITSAKATLDTLPYSIRSSFIPAIRDAQNEFVRLAMRGASVTANEIERASANLRVLQANAGRAAKAMEFSRSFGGGGGGRRDVELSLQAKSLQGYAAQLRVLQGAMGNLSTEARSRAFPAFMALEAAISRALL